MEIHAYSELYIDSAQSILGHAFDFALVTLGLNPNAFGKAFSVSDVSYQFASGNPAYVAGMNGCELTRAVLDEICMEYPAKEDAMYLDKSPEYWTGWALAFFQWYSDHSFADILVTVPLENILAMYPVYHEMDILQFTDQMQRLMNSSNPSTRLSQRRKACNLSQSKLAKVSGVPLRQIQLFEQRQRDINKTSALTLLKFSKALQCKMEDLMEK